MIPLSFDYVRAVSIRDALTALAAGDGSKVIAGGHSLIPVLKFRMAQPSRLVDIAHLDELKGVAPYRRGVRIGATTTYRDLLDSPLVCEKYAVLVDAVSNIGDTQVRNRGTIGGSVAHADPNSDIPPVLLVLDAQIGLRSKKGRRSVPAREFFLGAFTTAIAEDELLTHIDLPPLPRNAVSAYFSYDQLASGYSIVACAAVLGLSRKTITSAALAFTSVGDRATLIPAAGKLVGTRGEPGILAEVAEQSIAGLEFMGDVHTPAEYRRHLATVVVRKAVEKALARA